MSSALTGMLNGAVPLFTAIVAAGIARRWPPRSIAVGLAAGLAGGVLMALPTVGQGRSTALGVRDRREDRRDRREDIRDHRHPR